VKSGLAVVEGGPAAADGAARNENSAIAATDATNNCFTIITGLLVVFDGRQHELGLGCIEIFPQRFDEVYQVLFVAGGMSRILIFMPLPKDKTGDFVALAFVVRIILGKVL